MAYEFMVILLYFLCFYVHLCFIVELGTLQFDFYVIHSLYLEITLFYIGEPNVN